MAGLQIDQWYLQMPPITRAFMTACVATSVFEFLGVVGIMDFYLNFTLVTERYEVRLPVSSSIHSKRALASLFGRPQTPRHKSDQSSTFLL